MINALIDAWNDSFQTIPFLFAIYIALEMIERKFEFKVKTLLSSATRLGPVWGAIFGCIPQCGFSVIATVLFTQRVISLGTLLAVYISTSDEAIPVILAQPRQAGLIVPIVLVKVILAISAGYAIDFFFTRPPAEPRRDKHGPAEHSHCCGEPHPSGEPWWRVFLVIPLWHTVRIFFFILAVSCALNGLVFAAGQENLGRILLGHPILQPLAAVLVGLIPNCASSVAITEMFLKGGITFGSVIAGLGASAGFGTLVLMRENRDRKESLRIIGLLAGISFAAGLAINLLALLF